jgi:hypothetical protein
MNKSKPIAKRLLTQLLILIFLLYLFLLVVTMLMTVLVHRFDVTSNIVFDMLKSTAESFSEDPEKLAELFRFGSSFFDNSPCLKEGDSRFNERNLHMRGLTYSPRA